MRKTSRFKSRTKNCPARFIFKKLPKVRPWERLDLTMLVGRIEYRYYQVIIYRKKTMSKTNVKPLGNNVLVEPLSEEERGSKTKSGIFIPETIDKERPDQGTVVEVGPGKLDENGKRIPMSVKKGQRIVFAKYGPDEIKVGDKKYFIISEDNILAIIE